MNTIPHLLESVRQAAHGPSQATLAELIHFATIAAPTADELLALCKVDLAKPYGRRVMLATDRVEGMIARWTPGVSCAPHDHGGSFGAVRVLQGSAIHTVWQVSGGKIVREYSERVEAGEVMSVGPDVIHSMIDAGGSEPLVTLHLYIDPIDHMMVYDLDTGRTLMVDGGCGAWIPEDEPELIRGVHAGYHTAREVVARFVAPLAASASAAP